MDAGPGGAGTPGAWLLLPQTFMNASGRPVQMLAGFFKIKPEEILVVHDELDFPPGTARIKQGGGIAGHNGLRDISQRIASHEYWRLRLGVGKPPPGSEGADYVLQKPPAEERAAIDESIANALAILPLCLAGDIQGAMQKLHTQDRPAPAKKEPEKKAPEKREPEKKSPQKKEPPKPQAPVKGTQATAKAAEAPAKAAKPGLLKSLFGKK
jgi:PTH1 family peptidyl-tRNA hydrolase